MCNGRMRCDGTGRLSDSWALWSRRPNNSLCGTTNDGLFTGLSNNRHGPIGHTVNVLKIAAEHRQPQGLSASDEAPPSSSPLSEHRAIQGNSNRPVLQFVPAQATIL